MPSFVKIYRTIDKNGGRNTQITRSYLLTFLLKWEEDKKKVRKRGVYSVPGVAVFLMKISQCIFPPYVTLYRYEGDHIS